MCPKPIVLVDMNDVLCDYTQALLERFLACHPELRDEAEAAWGLWDLHKAFPDRFHEEIKDIPKRPGFFRELPPISGAVEGVKALAERAEVRICTAPKVNHARCVAEKYEWVEAHLGHAWMERIIITHDKTLVRGVALIDDKPRIAGAQQPAWQHLLFDRPYNRHVRDKPRIDWENWEEVVLPLL